MNKVPSCAAISVRKPFACGSEKALERGVEEHGPRRGQLGDVGDEVARVQLCAGIGELAKETVYEPGAPAPYEGPPSRMSSEGEHDREG